MEIDSDVQQRLTLTNQTHLLAYWPELNAQQRQQLIRDINDVDFDRVQQAFDAVKHELIDETPDVFNDEKKFEAIDDIMEPIPDHMAGSISQASKEQLDDYRRRGLKAISESSVAVLLLAGGQGTRLGLIHPFLFCLQMIRQATFLGVNCPKGMCSVDLPSNKTLYQLQAERIRRLEQYANEQCGTRTATISWFIMTSEHTQEQTANYFRSHDYFGLKSENIVLFEQHTLPALNFEGKILLEEKFKLTRAADGNGGLYRALKSRGIIDEMKKRQIQYVHVYCVDNILVRLADPIFLGFCLEKKADCAAKVVKKTTPSEAVGVICKVRDRFQVVEYSEISEQTANRRKENRSDELLFNAGNICNHFFTWNFLQDVCQKYENQLRYHIAKKKIPSLDANGIHISKPTEINGIKLEKFVFDVFPFSKSFAVWEVRREEEFSPLKNGSGPKDTVETCRRDLMLEHVRWLQRAGAHLPSDIYKQIENLSRTCEISPLVSYAGENLDFVKGKTLDLPIFIESMADKQEGIADSNKKPSIIRGTKSISFPTTRVQP